MIAIPIDGTPSKVTRFFAGLGGFLATNFIINLPMHLANQTDSLGLLFAALAIGFGVGGWFAFERQRDNLAFTKGAKASFWVNVAMFVIGFAVGLAGTI